MREIVTALLPEKRESGTYDLKRASVLVPFFEKEGELFLLFTKRREHLRHHGGQVAFPGGEQENGEDPVACALRESQEEIGLATPAIEVVGLLDDVETITFFQVTPVLAYLKELPPLKPQPQEVEKIFSVLFTDFLDEDKWTKDRSKTLFGKPYPVYYYHGAEEIIWGVTGRIVRRLVRRYQQAVVEAH